MRSANPASLAPPIGGWNTKDPPALLAPKFAQQMQNCIPRSSGIELRRGAIDWVTGFAHEVNSLMGYNTASGSNKLFAATVDGIFDATTAGAVGAAVSACTDGKWQHVNFATSAGQFLLMVNGVDSFRYYNGSTWTTTANFTYNAGNLATTNFIHINIFQSRVYLIHKNELAFYFSDTAGTIPGTIKRFDCDQLFARGGKLIAMGTWTVDGGTGPQDYAAFLSSEGEVAVFNGADPADANNWALQGIYFVGRPLGRRCFLKYGGDLLVLSDMGLYPLSKALLSATINRSIALTDNIFPTVSAYGQAYFSTFGWQADVLTAQGLLLLNVPAASRRILAMDTVSQAWCEFTGLDFNCIASFQGDLYGGGSTTVTKALTGTSDFGGTIKANMLFSPNYFKTRGELKVPAMIRPNYIANGPFTVTYGCSVDFELDFPTYTIAATSTPLPLWDTATFDSGRWGAGLINVRDWRDVAAYPGFALAPYIGLESKSASVNLLSVDVMRQLGGTM